MANHFRENTIEKNTQPELANPAVPDTGKTAGTEPPSPEKKKKRKKRINLGSKLKQKFADSPLRDKWILKNLPIILLIIFFAILHISNRYYVERLMKEKIEITDHIKYLREHQIQMQKNYQESIKISQIAKDLDSLGIGLTAGPPFEL